MKRKPYMAKSISGAQLRVRMLEARMAKDSRVFAEVYRDRGLLAKLAADGPCFFNPLDAMEAKIRRDVILSKEFGLNPDGTPIYPDPAPEQP